MPYSHNRRFKDVLLALGAVSSSRIDLQRIQLQKFIYLQDVFAEIWREVSKPARFQPEKRGPYDKHIQNAVDALAFRGLVLVTSHTFQGIRQARSCYRLSSAGLEAVESLISNPILHEEFVLAKEISREVERRGWDKIVKIVYSEPTYVVERARASGRVLSTNSPLENVTTQIIRAFQSAWAQDEQGAVSIRCFVQIAFLVFDQYREKQTEIPNAL